MAFMEKNRPNVTYANFASRMLSFFTDIFMIGMPISIFITILFGKEQMNQTSAIDLLANPEMHHEAPDPTVSILQIVLMMGAFILFWHLNGQTPGKRFTKTKVVDAKTFTKPSLFQLILRFLGYFLSFITIIGFFTGLFRRDKRTLHDLLSRTCVIVVK